MTRVLLTSNESPQTQLPFKTNCSYEGQDHSQLMESINQNIEIVLQDSIAQMTPTSVSLPLSLSGANTNGRHEQNSLMSPNNSIPNHHQSQQSNSNGNNGMSIAMSNGNSLLGDGQHLHEMMSSSQTHTLELHPSFVTNILEEPEMRPHMCSVCQATYKTRTHLRRHMFIHLTSRPYPCSDCGKGFNRKEHLNKHTEAVHSLKKYVCPYCSKEISRKDHLSRHIKNMHLSNNGTHIQLKSAGDGEISLANPKQTNSSTRSNKLPRMFPTGLTITSLNQVAQASSSKLLQTNGHLSNRLPGNPFNMDSQLNFSNSSQNATYDNKKLLLQLYTCPDCSATFTSERDLGIHSRVHKPQPYKCNECPRAYTRREKLTEHVRCFHQGQKFSCEYCGKELSRKDHVLRHVRSVHPEVLATRFVAIAESGGSFENSSTQIRSLNSTTSLHGSNGNSIPSMGDMSVLLRSVCHICLKVFGTAYHLCRHIESCHNGDVRPYTCTNCSKQFKRKDHLTKHLKSHCPSMRETSAAAAIRSIIRATTGNCEGVGDVLENSTLNALDAADLMHQDAIDSLQIEMMTDGEDEDGSGGSDSDTNDEDEDSKELPSISMQSNGRATISDSHSHSIKHKDKVKCPPGNVDFALAGLS